MPMCAVKNLIKMLWTIPNLIKNDNVIRDLIKYIIINFLNHQCQSHFLILNSHF